MNPSPILESNSHKNNSQSSISTTSAPSKSFNNGYPPRRDNPPRNPRNPPKHSTGDTRNGRDKGAPTNVTQSSGASSSRDPSQDDQGASKKGKSLNHLLNFSFPEREKGMPPQAPRRRVRVPVYNKERYIHASFRFLVSDTEQYVANLADPDLSVDWDNIERVIISNPQEQNCPICLSEPVAPRITRCGHVFCCTCVLHYLALGEHKWRRCPICYESVYYKDLKSAKINKMVPYSEGDTIRMVLMQKVKQSYVAWPRAHWNSSVLNMLPTPDDPIGNTFSKLILATLPELQQIYNSDKVQLETQLQEAHANGDFDSIPFIEQGLLSVEEKLKSWESNPLSKVSEQLRILSQKYKEKVTSPVATTASDAYHPPVQALLSSRSSSQTYLAEYENAFTDEESEGAVNDHEAGSQSSGSAKSIDDSRSRRSFSDSDLSDIEQAGPTNKSKGSNKSLASSTTSSSPPKDSHRVDDTLASSNYVIFYQAEDGQPIFAHQFILKALLSDRGSLENLPNVIEAKILELEEVSQTQEARKRFKNTAHLPLTSEFSFCEIDLKTSSLISPDTYKDFQSEIQNREQRRRSRAKKEEQANKRRQKHNLNDQHRYQRFLETYNSSFPAMVDPVLPEDSFPQIAPAAAQASEAKIGTSPKGNYAGIVKGASGAPEKPLFTDLDFAATLSLSSTAASKNKARSAPTASDFPSLGSSNFKATTAAPAWGGAAAKPAQAATTQAPPPSTEEPASKLNPKAASFTPGASSLTVPPPSTQPKDSEERPASEGSVPPPRAAQSNGQGGKKGGKGKKTLLMTTASHHRY